MVLVTNFSCRSVAVVRVIYSIKSRPGACLGGARRRLAFQACRLRG
jgi:hypothetical protein